MAKFSQSSGVLQFGTIQVNGYAGRDEGKNNPAMQNVPNVGPLPQGHYTIEIDNPFQHPRCGPYCLRLIPDESNDMFGRSGFLIHGDSIDAPGTASHGCIIVPQYIRRALVATGESRLEVTE